MKVIPSIEYLHRCYITEMQTKMHIPHSKHQKTSLMQLEACWDLIQNLNRYFKAFQRER